MPIRPEVVEAVHALLRRRQGAFMEEVAATGDAVRADYAKRGLRTPAMGRDLMEKVTKIVKRYVEEALGEVLALLAERGELDDSVAEWLNGEADRLVGEFGGTLRGVPGALQGTGGPWEAAKAELAREAEMRISYLTRLAKAQITTDRKLAKLGPARPAERESPEPGPVGVLAAQDEQVVAKLKAVCPSAAGAYEQAVRDLAGAARSGYRGPATDMREALRETLAALAPDDEVERQSWYKPVKGCDKPTMAQRARYALEAARKSEQVTGAAVGSVEVSEELFARFVRDVYGRSNVSTHTHAGKAEAEKMHGLIRVVLADLLGL
jgi:hypothetical protein